MHAKLVVFAAIALSASLIHSQEKNCSVLVAIARMARAKSVSALIAAKPKADDYTVRAVFATRQFEMMPDNKDAAILLLNAIPRNEDEQDAWMTIGSSLCDSESVRDMTSLGTLADRLARDLAHAAILVPARMQDYVWYAAEASSDPHSDYLIQMQKVCRRRHTAFTSAVQQLNGDGASDHFTAVDAGWFRAHMFNPDTCRALMFPEAD
jgi:hypothetical protein